MRLRKRRRTSPSLGQPEHWPNERLASLRAPLDVGLLGEHGTAPIVIDARSSTPSRWIDSPVASIRTIIEPSTQTHATKFLEPIAGVAIGLSERMCTEPNRRWLNCEKFQIQIASVGLSICERSIEKSFSKTFLPNFSGKLQQNFLSSPKVFAPELWKNLERT